MCEHIFSILRCHLSVGYLFKSEEMSLTTNQKEDTLQAAFESFKDSQQKNYQTLEEKLHKF